MTFVLRAWSDWSDVFKDLVRMGRADLEPWLPTFYAPWNSSLKHQEIGNPTKVILFSRIFPLHVPYFTLST